MIVPSLGKGITMMATAGILGAESAFAAHNLTVFIGPALAIVIAFFSLRSMQTSIYKQNYEAQRDRAEEAERQRDHYREQKHEAMTELASSKGQLELERRKTDLTEVTNRLDALQIMLEAIQRNDQA